MAGSWGNMVGEVAVGEAAAVDISVCSVASASYGSMALLRPALGARDHGRDNVVGLRRTLPEHGGKRSMRNLQSDAAPRADQRRFLSFGEACVGAEAAGAQTGRVLPCEAAGEEGVAGAGCSAHWR